MLSIIRKRRKGVYILEYEDFRAKRKVTLMVGDLTFPDWVSKRRIEVIMFGPSGFGKVTKYIREPVSNRNVLWKTLRKLTKTYKYARTFFVSTYAFFRVVTHKDRNPNRYSRHSHWIMGGNGHVYHKHRKAILSMNEQLMELGLHKAPMRGWKKRHRIT